MAGRWRSGAQWFCAIVVMTDILLGLTLLSDFASGRPFPGRPGHGKHGRHGEHGSDGNHANLPPGCRGHPCAHGRGMTETVAVVDSASLPLNATTSDSLSSSSISSLVVRIGSVVEKRICRLPGLYDRFPSPHYSGYVYLNDTSTITNSTRRLYYYFVRSERDLASDPVVLWLNGGPGCSSMFGFALGNGPFRFTRGDSTGSLPELSVNPDAWSKVANMIFLDSPFGVGLSRSQQTPSPVRTDDLATSADLHRFLLEWMKAHPTFTKNPLYLAGESYAGVYIPMLAQKIVKGLDTKLQPLLNLKGYLIGNGVVETPAWNSVFNSYGIVSKSRGLSIINAEMYEWVTSECGSLATMNEIWTAPDACQSAVRDYAFYFLIFATVRRINVYNVGGECVGPLPDIYDGLNLTASKSQATSSQMAALVSQLPKKFPFGSTPCLDTDWLGNWFNNDAVRLALNVPPVSEIGEWLSCATQLEYDQNGGDMVALHKTLTSQYGLRVLIYSGDHDLVVPSAGTESWIKSLGYGEAFPGSTRWMGWTVGDQTTGFRQIYEKKLTYATVLGSGHAVPTDKPEAALKLFQSWIDTSDTFPL
ncbi:hypothetical protein CBR_g48916 [Chara braunii]|uniref:Carboxypeptidase n=1 Tax=Chara braunii TaxID=69332 RepID=A0A388M3N9_CHABU|nr:hypothetical protein CBR_g48916 [Chara braunii]|eukprot:GBG89208.1 hypothetical protein CBR_g48916 [Chara braunii]